MASIGEALGMSLPGSASAPAVDRRRDDAAYASGEAVVRLIELNGAGVPAVERVPLDVGRPLATIEGPIEQLLRDPALEEATGARVRAILTDETLPLQARARLQRRFPHLAELRYRPPEVARAAISSRQAQVRQARSPQELTTAFYADQQGRPARVAEAQLLREALEAASRGEER
jgi:exonuclease SbcD